MTICNSVLMIVKNVSTLPQKNYQIKKLLAHFLIGCEQNRRQKIFIRGFNVCVRGWQTKLTKTQLIYSVSYFNLGGAWTFYCGG